jgi:hypothetical protein
MQYVSAKTLLKYNISNHFKFSIPTNSIIFSFHHNQIIIFLSNSNLIIFPYNIKLYILILLIIMIFRDILSALAFGYFFPYSNCIFHILSTK